MIFFFQETRRTLIVQKLNETKIFCIANETLELRDSLWNERKSLEDIIFYVSNI